MKAPTFWQGVALAVVLALVGSVGMAVLPLALPLTSVWKLVVTTLAFTYVLYLLGRSRERTGRVVVPGVLLLITVASWSLMGVTAFALLQVGLIWLARALYHHRGVIAALIDMGLSAFACAAAVWALGTGSYFVTIWCFFLVQALFVWIPDFARRQDLRVAATDADFEASRKLADAALRRLATGR